MHPQNGSAGPPASKYAHTVRHFSKTNELPYSPLINLSLLFFLQECCYSCLNGGLQKVRKHFITSTHTNSFCVALAAGLGVRRMHTCARFVRWCLRCCEEICNTPIPSDTHEGRAGDSLARFLYQNKISQYKTQLILKATHIQQF